MKHYKNKLHLYKLNRKQWWKELSYVLKKAITFIKNFGCGLLMVINAFLTCKLKKYVQVIFLV